MLYPGTHRRPHMYRLDVVYDPEGGEESIADYPEERCIELIRAAIGIPDIPVTLHKVLTWEMAARVADSFQQGRMFLVGDSARIQPPSGGLGGNTGIAEAHNLAWKLAAVLRGETAGPDLLGTDDAERRPVADYGSGGAGRHAVPTERETEGSEGITVTTLHVNMGYRYPEGAIVPESAGKTSLTCSRPSYGRGSRGPARRTSFWSGTVRPFNIGPVWFRFVPASSALTGQNWLEAAQLARALHLPMDIYRIGEG
ncbi:FAD-dependent monooxygenase [Paenibacillus sp. JTLBN-2024]